MNYYEHHIGDYAQATAHLTFVEDAAYSRLIRKYYAEERPIPADLKAAQRLIGARSREEREAVQAVLEEFFTLQADGWHSKRCDEEIAAYHVKQEKARASANARWEKRNASGMRTHSGTDANASAGDGCERNANASETHDGRNAHQTPDTRHQTPDQEQEHAAGKTVTPAGALCARLRSEAGLIQVNPSDPRLLAALAAGVEPDLIVQIAKANPTKPQQYAVATAIGQHNDAASQAAGATHGKPATRGQPARRLSAVERVEAAARNAGFEIGDRPATGRTFDADSA